jgi:putative transposase
MVKAALNQRRTDPGVVVPWTGFDLINAFNAWKKTSDAGRVFSVGRNRQAQIVVAGLAWRGVPAGVRGSRRRSGQRAEGLVGFAVRQPQRQACGFPHFKKKTGAVVSFRLRNKHPKGRPPAIRVGEGNRARSVTLPGIGQIRVHDDTRRLRRVLTKNRAKVLFVTVSQHAGRWWVSLNVEATELHPAHRHSPRVDGDHGGWVGIDRGLAAFLVAAGAGGTEAARITDAPKALARGLNRQRGLAKSLSRKQKGSRNRRDAAAKLGRHHHRIAKVRRHFLHQVSNALVNTHDRLVIENLNVSGMLANPRLAPAISDAGWATFARLVKYKQAWRGGELVIADRWYPSSRLCPHCGAVRGDLTLADRAFTCGCGHVADRDANAAVNLARWGQAHHQTSSDLRTPKQRGRATNARRRDGSDQGAPPGCGGHPSCAGETSPDDAGTDVHAAPAA